MRLDAAASSTTSSLATPSLATAASSLDRLVSLTAPGAQVAPVVEELRTVEQSLRDALPGLRQSRTGASLVDQLDRVRNSAGTLRESLEELMTRDGMTSFDPAFTSDDASWDTWFTHSAQLVRDAASSD